MSAFILKIDWRTLQATEVWRQCEIEWRFDYDAITSILMTIIQV